MRTQEATAADAAAIAAVETRAREILRAFEEERWTDVVAAFDSAGLQSFKTHQLEILRMMPTPAQTLDDYKQQHPGLPDIVAEYEFERDCKARERLKVELEERLSSSGELERTWWEEAIRSLSQEFSQENEIERNEKRSAAGIAEEKLRGSDARMVERMLDPDAFAPWRAMYNATQVATSVLGTIMEHAALAHVIYRILWRTSHEKLEPGATRIMTLRKRDAEWWMDFDADAFEPEIESFGFTVSYKPADES